MKNDWKYLLFSVPVYSESKNRQLTSCRRKCDHSAVAENYDVSSECLDFPTNEHNRSNNWKKRLGKLKLEKSTILVIAIGTNYQEMQLIFHPVEVLSIETAFLSRRHKLQNNYKDIPLMYKSLDYVLLPVLIQSDLGDFYLS